MFSVFVFLMTAGKATALSLNPVALDAAIWKQNTITKISNAEMMFKILLGGAIAREEYPMLENLNTASLSSERDKKKFAEMAKIVFPAFDENILTDVVEITWATPTNNGILLFSPEDMKAFEALSPAAVIKLKIDGYRDNKYYSLALSSMKKNRIFSIEDGAPVVWLMPDVTQTQFLIEQTARIIMKMKEEKR